MQSSVACQVLLCDKGKYGRERGWVRKDRVWRTKEAMICGVINLQVFPQPLVLLKEELQSKFQKKVNLGGERDDVHRPKVPAVDKHQCNDTQNKISQRTGKAKGDCCL